MKVDFSIPKPFYCNIITIIRTREKFCIDSAQTCCEFNFPLHDEWFEFRNKFFFILMFDYLHNRINRP